MASKATLFVVTVWRDFGQVAQVYVVSFWAHHRSEVWSLCAWQVLLLICRQPAAIGIA